MSALRRLNRLASPLFLLTYVALLGLFFAMTEIQIEGADGWAGSLPTWRLEKHPLLDIFWGGRAMTGYHAWVFPFMFLVFHFPHLAQGRFTWRIEARCLGSLMLFWMIEDFLWFVLNPAFGIERFAPGLVPWHKHWLFLVPVDYLLFTAAGVGLVALSYRAEWISTARERAG